MWPQWALPEAQPNSCQELQYLQKKQYVENRLFHREQQILDRSCSGIKLPIFCEIQGSCDIHMFPLLESTIQTKHLNYSLSL